MDSHVFRRILQKLAKIVENLTVVKSLVRLSVVVCH